MRTDQGSALAASLACVRPPPAPMRPSLLLALALLTGCTTSRVADFSSSAARAEVNDRADRGHPVLHLAGDRGRQVRSLHIAPDVTTWVDKKTGESRSAPTPDIEAVAFRRDGLGALQGVGIGIGVGALVGTWVGATDGVAGGGRGFTYSPAAGALLGAAMGAEVGAIVGAIRSNRVVYEAVPPCLGPPLACAAPLASLRNGPSAPLQTRGGVASR